MPRRGYPNDEFPIAQLPDSMQLVRKAVGDEHDTPPAEPPRFIPPVTVNPDRLARSARETLGPPPWIVVTRGPLTLRTATGLPTTRPPAYVPSVTTTSSPSAAALTASWMLMAALAQVSYGCTAFVLPADT